MMEIVLLYNANIIMQDTSHVVVLNYSKSVVFEFLPNEALVHGLAAKAWLAEESRSTDIQLGLLVLI